VIFVSDNITIHVRNVGKKYTIGGPQEKYLSLRDAIVNSVKAPFHRILHRNSDQSANEFWALKDVSFDVEQGEVVGIIGRNGAGKSTLLKILSRITAPTEGTVELHGRVGSLLEVGTGFHPDLTGRENIFLSGSILGMKRQEIDEKLDEIVKFSEIEKFLDTPVKRYSSGMYVRLAFAVAAHLEPEILLVDEVLAVGDATFQKKCLGKMGEVAKEGRTVLFVSHNMTSILNLCQRVIVLDHGILIDDSEPKKAIGLYLTSGTKETGIIVWDDMKKAPGDDVVRLNSVSIIQSGHPTCEVDISQEMSIQIEYKNLVDNSSFYVAIYLLDQLGNLVFCSVNMNSFCLTPDPLSGKSLPKGLYRTSCTIPANFLNTNYYSIGIGIIKYPQIMGPHHVHIMERPLLSFHAIDLGNMLHDHNKSGAWDGIVRPKLIWSSAPMIGEDR
jgi:lipopolysaccharide transport system ATP-binding protein